LEAGNHTITIKAVDDWDNSAQINTTVTAPEFLRTDLNKDGTVNIMDIAIVAKAYGTKLGDEEWNEIADMDKNGEINIIDIAKVAKDYGKTI